MGQKLVFSFGGFKGVADMEGASVIFGESFEKGADPHKLNLRISDESKKHPAMGYTTDIETLGYIFKLLTLRSSSLTNANLNDPMEKERVGVSELASSRFITCFCHMDHECVPFWMYYGKSIRKNKVLMQFKNFADSFVDCIYTDYVLVKDGKRALFTSDEYGDKVNGQYFDDSIQKEYDLRAIIDTLMMFDVEYVPCSSEVFTKENAGETQIEFGKITGQSNAVVTIQGYDSTILGKQKSNPWDYEKETRILSSLAGAQNPDWDYIDLRLKPEIFLGLKIILSPWDEGGLRENVQAAIDASPLPQEIKDTIVIVDSALKGKLNFPEGK